jgi:hypothetical protein
MTMLDSDRLSLDSKDRTASAASWGAIVAGALAAVATTLILIVLGGGLGLAAVSPWYNSSASAATVGIAAVVWLIVVQWISSVIGGYIAGRLRTKWTGLHSDEVFFRDTAHGFLAWCLASVAGAVLLAGAGAITLGGVAAGAAGAAVGRTADQSDYFVDTLYRPAETTDAGAVPANSAPAAMPAPTSASGGSAANADMRGETSRILSRDLVNSGITPDDRAYLGQLVAARTGLNQHDAQDRVDTVIGQMDAARKRASEISIVTALAMVVGAFIAAVSGALGGDLRDDHEPMREMTLDANRRVTATMRGPR